MKDQNISELDFRFFEELLKRESGLAITTDKAYLLESRLLPVASKYNIRGLDGIANKLRETRDAELKRAVVEAMTTNETSFFRDNTPFQKVRDGVLPYLTRTRAITKTLRIWSAACSSGQEPYSIAMLLRESGLLLDGWRVDIVASDLSEAVLDQARNGVYTQFEVQRGLPVHMLVKYFAQDGDRWRVKPEVKAMVNFRTFNLLNDPAALGQFDLVFCRNVLIYFDLATKDRVLKSVHNVVRRDGFLLLGGTETVLGITEAFKSHPDIKGVYVREDSAFDQDVAASATAVK